MGTASGGSAAALVGSSRGGAVGVSRAATLKARGAVVGSISCGAAGECAAGGFYRQGNRRKAFVVSETNGSWGKAIEVPGTATLNKGGHAEVDSVSCPAAGECAAGGYYTDGSSHQQAFVVTETNGSWGNAIEVPGTATLNAGAFAGHGAAVDSVSCAAAGECAAGGHYTDGSENGQAFVVTETDGIWGNAIEVPGTATLNADGIAGVKSVSCAAAGECAAGGGYTDGSGNAQAFVVDETDGSWRNAVEVPGTATLNTGGLAGVGSISCAAAGDCAAGGHYEARYSQQAFVVSETNGSWETAIEVPGTATLNKGGGDGNNGAETVSISCAAPGDCAAGGLYTDGGGNQQAFVVDESNGSWGNAIKVPGTASLNPGGTAGVDSISCAAVGDCAAGGYSTGGYNSAYNAQAFVVGELNGIWGTALKVPGAATLNTGGFDGEGAAVNSISCAASGECAAGGYYTSGYFSGRGSSGFGRRAYVVSETKGNWRNAIQVFPACVDPNVVGKMLSAAKKTLHASDCGLGTIKKVYSKVKKGRVVAQQPIPGKLLKAGAKVALAVSKGTKT